VSIEDAAIETDEEFGNRIGDIEDRIFSYIEAEFGGDYDATIMLVALSGRLGRFLATHIAFGAPKSAIKEFQELIELRTEMGLRAGTKH
jgi:hypothetical protein